MSWVVTSSVKSQFMLRNSRCIFHDENYLKGDNYRKHREEVARRFEKKSSESSLEFIGYVCQMFPLRTSGGYFVDYTADTANFLIFLPVAEKMI